MADSKEKLFSDFPAVSTEQWMEKITADLKGADFEKKLVWRTNEGFKVKPFYRQEDLEGLKTTEGLPGEFPYVRGTKKNDNTWFVRQEIKVECPKEANAKALDILNKGVDSLGFYVKKKDLSPEYIETLLNDICAECIELNFSKSGTIKNYLKGYRKGKVEYETSLAVRLYERDFLGIEWGTIVLQSPQNLTTYCLLDTDYEEVMLEPVEGYRLIKS